MRARLLIVAAGSLTLCAWGAAAVIVGSFLLGDAVSRTDWVLLSAAAMLAVAAWAGARLAGTGLGMLGLLSSRLWGFIALFVFVFSFALPGLLLRSSDPIDLIVAAAVAAAIAGLGQWVLQRHVFSAPDTIDGIDGPPENEH